MKILFQLLIVFVLCTAAFSQSIIGISGTMTSNQSVVITGSSFGSKSAAEPVKWDNFEGGSNGGNVHGQSPIIGSNWFVWYVANQAVYSNQNQKTNSTLNSYHNHSDSNGSYTIALRETRSSPGWATAYFTFWSRAGRDGSIWSRNMKPWIIYGSGEGDDEDQPAAYIGDGTGEDDPGFRSGQIDNNGSTQSTLYGCGNVSTIENEWVRWEVYLKQSSQSTADGEFRVWLHRPNAGTPPAVANCMNDQTFVSRVTENYWNEIWIGAYYDTSPTDANSIVYIDDVYIDTTMARVEIGNAQSWGDCTLREIQIPSAWATGSITVTVNRGSFGASDNAYLFVVDSDGNVSDGYPITFGTTYSETATVHGGITFSGCAFH